MPTIVPSHPTNLAPLPRLLAYTQSLGLEAFLGRRKRGVRSLVVSLVWLMLAWRGSGRPAHVADLGADPLARTILGLTRLPDAETLRRGLRAFPAKAVRGAVEAAYRAELPRRTGRVWVAVDAHQLPYWGRGQTERLRKGWAGAHGRALRGYRLYLAVDCGTAQVVTFVLARGNARDAALAAVLAARCRTVLGRRLAGVVADCGFTTKASLAALRATGVPFIVGFARTPEIKKRLAALTPQQRRWLGGACGAVRLGVCPWDAELRLVALGARTPGDTRGPWVYVTSLRSYGPQRVIHIYRRRWRAEQAIEELKNGNDLDHLVTTRLAPNRAAVGLRLLARNLAIGLQLADAAGSPSVLREPRAFRLGQVDGLGVFTTQGRTVRIVAVTSPTTDAAPTRSGPPGPFRLPWTRLVVRPAA